MKRILIASTAILFTTAAYAADPFVYNPETPAPIVQAPGFSWTGFYVGANVGYGGGKARVDGYVEDLRPATSTRDESQQIARFGGDLNGPIITSFESFGEDWDEEDLEKYLADLFNNSNTNIFSAGLGQTGSGFIGGIQAGYNWQHNQLVFGVETDFQWSGIKAELSGHLGNGTTYSGELGSKIKWYGSTRLRLGFTPVERFMVYATGGVAYGSMNLYGNLYANNTLIGSFDKSKTRVGWTAGIGTEYAVTDRVSIKGEYLYTDLGKWNLIDWTSPNGWFHAHADHKFAFHTFRIGVNFHF